MTLRVTMLAILIPMVALLGFFTYQSYTKSMAEVGAIEYAREGVLEARLLYDAVHELQKERGYSAGFISSKASKFANELARQRIETDRVVGRLRKPLPHTRLAAPDLMARIDEDLAALEDWRDKVDHLTLGVPQMAQRYTGLIQTILDTGSKDAPRFTASSLPELLEAKTLLAQAKENAGLERAMGATGLGAGNFEAGIHTNFVSLGAAQMALLETSAKLLRRPEFLEGIYTSQAAADVFRLRRILTNSVHDDGVSRFQGITAGKWFQVSTAWIDSLRAAELALSDEIRALTEAELAQKRSDQFREIGLVGAIVIVTLIFSTTIFERMIYRVRRLIRIMAEFKEGNFEAHVPYIKGRSEINIMADAIYRFKQETLANRRAMAKAKEDDEAILNAKHQRVVDLVTEGLSALADADLSLVFREPLDPEYDSIRNDFNTATERLRFVLIELSDSVREISDRADQTARASEELATRTTQQDSTLRETGDSVGLISQAVEGDHERLESASAAAGTARETADKSGGIMRNAVVAMDRISDSSDKISQIISLIDEISFQTNLLALNAGVEAARAGEAGRGFAVVASEVRALARRSSEAALDIKTLITESRVQVQEGVDLVGRAGDSLTEIFTQIEEVDRMLQTVSASSKRQTEDLAQVNHAMSTLQTLTEANSVMVSESRSVSTTLADLAMRLSERIAEFRLRGQTKKEDDDEDFASAA